MTQAVCHDSLLPPPPPPASLTLCSLPASCHSCHQRRLRLHHLQASLSQELTSSLGLLDSGQHPLQLWSPLQVQLKYHFFLAFPGPLQNEPGLDSGAPRYSRTPPNIVVVSFPRVYVYAPQRYRHFRAERASVSLAYEQQGIPQKRPSIFSLH